MSAPPGLFEDIDAILSKREGYSPHSRPTVCDESPSAPPADDPPPRLGAAYNLFDGEELLEASIRSLRPVVTYVVVVYQRRSNFGEACSPTLLPLLRRLLAERLVDRLVEYENSDTGFSHTDKVNMVSPRATGSDLGGARAHDIADPFFNELRKREIGRQHCMRAGCTHFMSIDTDEFYLRDALRAAWQRMIAGKYDVVACRMRFFFKFPRCELVPMDEENHVTAIFRVDSLMPMRLGHPYPMLLDPTRRIFGCTRLLILQRSELEMYHYSFVRRNILSKVVNVTNRGNYENDLRDFLSKWPTWRPGQPLCHPHPYFARRFQKTRIVPNWFDVSIGPEFSLGLLGPLGRLGISDSGQGATNGQDVARERSALGTDAYSQAEVDTSTSTSNFVTLSSTVLAAPASGGGGGAAAGGGDDNDDHATVTPSSKSRDEPALIKMSPALAMDIKLLRASASDLFSSRRFEDSSRIYLEIASTLKHIDVDSSDHVGIVKEGTVNPIKVLKVNAATCNIKARKWQDALTLCDEVLSDEPTDTGTGLSKGTRAKALYTRALSRWQLKHAREDCREACLADLDECIALQGSTSSQVVKLKRAIEKHDLSSAAS